MYQTKLKNGQFIYHHGKSDYIGKKISKSNDYFERKYLNIIKDQLDGFYGDKKIDILEVGANIGNHVHFYANHLNVNKIHAYEPLADNVHILKENCKAFKKKVIINEYGLGNKDHKVSFFVNTKNYGASSTSPKYETNQGYKTEITIKKWDIVNKKKYDFIKIDIEGAEESIFDEIYKTVSISKPILAIECNYRSYEGIDKFLSFIEKIIKLGYDLTISDFDFLFIPNKTTSLSPNFINDLSEEFENQTKIYKLSKLRDKYDSAQSRKERKFIKGEYKENIFKGRQIKSWLLWSKLYVFFTFKWLKG